MENREREGKALPLGWKKIEGNEDYYLNESTMDIAWDLEEVFQICKEDNIEQDGLLHEEAISGLDFDDETNIDNLLNDDSDKNDHEDGKESSILNADENEILHDKDHQGAPNLLLADSPISCTPAYTKEDFQPSGIEDLEENIEDGEIIKTCDDIPKPEQIKDSEHRKQNGQDTDKEIKRRISPETQIPRGRSRSPRKRSKNQRKQNKSTRKRSRSRSPRKRSRSKSPRKRSRCTRNRSRS